MPIEYERDKEEQRVLRDQDAEFYDARLIAKGVYYGDVEWAFTQRALKLKPEEILFDAGCGTGRLTVRLAPFVRKIEACDYSERSLDVLSRKLEQQNIANVSVHAVDLTKPLPYPDQSFDKLYSNQTLQHLPAHEQPATLAEFHRVLKKGGALVLMLYRLGGQVTGTMKEGYFEGEGKRLYRYAYSPQDIEEKLLTAGFTNVRVQGLIVGPRFINAIAVRLGLAPLIDRIMAAIRKKSDYVGVIAEK